MTAAHFIPRKPRFVPPEGILVACGFPSWPGLATVICMSGIGTCTMSHGRRVALTLRPACVAAALLAGVVPAHAEETVRLADRRGGCGRVVPAHAEETPRPGRIHGQVLDAATRRPLAAAAVVVLDRGLATVTGGDGRFTLTGVPAGLHRVQIVLVGYESAILHDVVVRPSRVTPLAVELDEAAPTVREVVEVTADYFSREEEAAVGTVSFSFEEIRRAPGSAGDVSRMLQVLPSVGMATDQRNDLVVRGGSPGEHLTVVDNIEIPNINHFPSQGASGGVIGLLNTDLIADVSFSAGGFGVEHGDRLSSVMVVTQREGNRSGLDGEIATSMAGAGLLLEGPLAGGRGSWALSARRSYLELIAGVVGAIGTGGAVPRYSDVQGMATVDVSPTHRLQALGLGGFDAIDLSLDDREDSAVVSRARQYVGGLNWRWLWSGNGFAETSIARTRADYGVRVTEAAGDGTRVLFDNDSREQEVVLRSHWRHRPRTGTALAWGVTARRLSGDFDVFDGPDRTRIGTRDEQLDVSVSLTGRKAGAFASVEQAVGPRLTVTLGGRFDYFTLNRQGALSPRLGLAYDVDPRTTLTAAAGVYRQTLPAWLLVQHPDNRRLDNQRANHYVAGVRRRLTPSTLLSVEAYRKDYRELPFDPDDPTALVVDQFADFRTPAPGRLVGGGRARSHGVEGLIRKKLAQDFYGLVSYAYAVSRYTDGTGVERNRTFDHRHVASVVIGYRPNDRFELSGRWRYAGGRPYSPFDPVLSAQAGAGIVRREQINAERHPAYHRLDLRFNHRRHYPSVTLVSFFSVLNVYDRDNVFHDYWDVKDNRPRRATQWGLLPVGGFELEF